ncbi:M20/M25/M40 family metallo-hydrolase [Dyella sp. GSA-30]|uniref:M20/M25/M40 family metallo-hydrolase n=1 Tax=Dyella sp. GSA-30 TaxID=2994496 RepID=UPI0024910F4F|nr:M20/M25/M40 family metallo-hydrolase [Dyella sp. GSA-30]BDU19504.1 aminopeptidase [Dyella sp. GSA-30]
MSKKKAALAAALLCLVTTVHAAEPPELVWISLAQDASLTEDLRFGQRLSVQKGSPHDSLALLVEYDQLDTLAEQLRSESRHGAGFIVHSSLEDALSVQAVERRPGYDIDQHETVRGLIGQIDETRLIQVIEQLSRYQDRRHRSETGAQASLAIRDLWQSWAGNRADVKVAQVTHARTPQKSVVLTMTGSEKPDEIIVLGGHLDSTSNALKAPGADDNASGIASLSEVVRVLLQNNYRPKRTLQFMAYAAEEVGLVGSGEIAQRYRNDGIDVLGALQLDMTNYKGSSGDIYIYEDYTDRMQNDFLRRLITTYQPDLQIGTSRCGYGCSDHASWNRYGYAASLPFEARFDQANPSIHTANDTLEKSGGNATHTAKFARLALSYAIELGSGTRVVSSAATQE